MLLETYFQNWPPYLFSDEPWKCKREKGKMSSNLPVKIALMTKHKSCEQYVKYVVCCWFAGLFGAKKYIFPPCNSTGNMQIGKIFFCTPESALACK